MMGFRQRQDELTGRERCPSRGAPSSSRIRGVGWGVAILGIISASGCALLGNLDQFDGAVAADATAEGAARDAAVGADGATGDATETSEASLDAGADIVVDASDADSAAEM